MRVRIATELVATATQANLALLKPEIAMASPDTTDRSIEIMEIMPKAQPSMPDSMAPSPVNGKSNLI